MSYKEEIGLIGLIIIAFAGIVYGLHMEITVPAVVALIAYIGGNRNGHNQALESNSPPRLIQP